MSTILLLVLWEVGINYVGSKCARTLHDSRYRYDTIDDGCFVRPYMGSFLLAVLPVERNIIGDGRDNQKPKRRAQRTRQMNRPSRNSFRPSRRSDGIKILPVCYSGDERKKERGGSMYHPDRVVVPGTTAATVPTTRP
jgi:hypothetical protein